MIDPLSFLYLQYYYTLAVLQNTFIPTIARFMTIIGVLFMHTIALFMTSSKFSPLLLHRMYMSKELCTVTKLFLHSEFRFSM
jgi:hypothetical protein